MCKIAYFFAYICFVNCTLLHFIVSSWAKVSFLNGLCKNSLSTACPACILLLVDILHFLSSLLTVPGLDCSSTDALFRFKSLILLPLHFDSRRSLERDWYRIAQSMSLWEYLPLLSIQAEHLPLLSIQRIYCVGHCEGNFGFCSAHLAAQVAAS